MLSIDKITSGNNNSWSSTFEIHILGYAIWDVAIMAMINILASILNCKAL